MAWAGHSHHRQGDASPDSSSGHRPSGARQLEAHARKRSESAYWMYAPSENTRDVVVAGHEYRASSETALEAHTEEVSRESFRGHRAAIVHAQLVRIWTSVLPRLMPIRNIGLRGLASLPPSQRASGSRRFGAHAGKRSQRVVARHCAVPIPRRARSRDDRRRRSHDRAGRAHRRLSDRSDRAWPARPRRATPGAPRSGSTSATPASTRSSRCC